MGEEISESQLEDVYVGRKPLPNARFLAQGIAQLIVDNCYRTRTRPVPDLLLFGSAVDPEAKHRDIDILIIHSLRSLDRLEFLTEEGDPYYSSLTVEQPPYPAVGRAMSQEVLTSMGCRECDDFENLHVAIEHSFAEAALRNPPTVVSFVYQGVREVIDPKENYMREVNRIYEKYKQRNPQHLIEEFMRRENPNFEEEYPLDYLDLQIMPRRLLNPVKRWSCHRRRAIDDSRDPLFWQTTFRMGALYDAERKDFTIPIEEKYPDCIKLFKP